MSALLCEKKMTCIAPHITKLGLEPGSVSDSITHCRCKCSSKVWPGQSAIAQAPNIEIALLSAVIHEHHSCVQQVSIDANGAFRVSADSSQLIHCRRCVQKSSSCLKLETSRIWTETTSAWSMHMHTYSLLVQMWLLPVFYWQICWRTSCNPYNICELFASVAGRCE